MLFGVETLGSLGENARSFFNDFTGDPKAGSYFSPHISNLSLSIGIKEVLYFNNHLFFRTPIPKGSDFPEWPAVGSNWSPHMSINRTLELKGSLLKERGEFWEKIYDEHYRNPVPPILPTDTSTVTERDIFN